MISRISANNWKQIARAVLIYAAGAWALIEAVDFAVSKYGLSRLLLDGALLVAFGGGMVTAVLAWFRSAPGRQRGTKLETGIVGALILATVTGVVYLGMQGPSADFDRLDGYRLSFEFRRNGFGGDGDEGKSFTLGQISGMEVVDEDHFFCLEASDAKISGANIEVLAEEVPVMYRGREDEEWVVITFVLPFQPNELKALGQTGQSHDQLKINLRRLSVDISEPFELIENPGGMVLRFDK